MAKKVVTGEVRLSYVTLFEPKAITEGDDLKYSVSAIIPKSDKDTLKRINTAVNELLADNKDMLKIVKGEDGKWKSVKGQKPIRLPLRDGDEEKDDEAYEDCFFLTPSHKNKPIVVDEDRQEIIDPREIYSGCYGRVSMNFFAYDKAGNRGIGCSLNSVQKLRDGDSLGGGYTKASIEEDFGDDMLD